MKAFLLDRLRRNPFVVYSVFRRIRPTLKVPGREIWMLFDYETVKRALNTPDEFSSRAAPPGGAPLDWLIFLDPPQHTKLRAIISRTFTPRSVAALEPRVREISRALLDSAMRHGEFDLVRDFSAQLPLLVIGEMLGIPADKRETFLGWADAILHLGDSIAGGDVAARAIARYRVAKTEMSDYLAGLLEDDAALAGEDLISRLHRAEVDGARLTFDEILDFFQLLLLAGSETTTNLIGNAILCFDAHREQLARVRADPALIPGAIEEVLRFRSPVTMVFRTTTRDVTVNGTTIPAGKLVLPMIGAANRDPGRFGSPGSFDIARAGGHVGFGHGIHFCIGAALARMEARVALEELLPRLGDFRVHNWEPATGLNVSGPATLRVSPGRR